MFQNVPEKSPFWIKCSPDKINNILRHFEQWNYYANLNLLFSEILVQHKLSNTLEKLFKVLKRRTNFHGSESGYVLFDWLIFHRKFFIIGQTPFIKQLYYPKLPRIFVYYKIYPLYSCHLNQGLACHLAVSNI